MDIPVVPRSLIELLVDIGEDERRDSRSDICADEVVESERMQDLVGVGGKGCEVEEVGERSRVFADKAGRSKVEISHDEDFT